MKNKQKPHICDLSSQDGANNFAGVSQPRNPGTTVCRSCWYDLGSDIYLPVSTIDEAPCLTADPIEAQGFCQANCAACLAMLMQSPAPV